MRNKISKLNIRFSIKLSVLTLFSSLIISGGGDTPATGSSISSERVGIFLDSAVNGLKYTNSPSTHTGTTDALGRFSYTVGDTITFYIDNFEIGTATTNSVITPADIADGDNGTKTNKIAVLLQSLDKDQDATNGIDISYIELNATNIATITTIFNLNTTTAFTTANIVNFRNGATAYTITGSAATTTITAISINSATAHIKETKKNIGAIKIVNGKLLLTAATLNTSSNTVIITEITVKDDVITTTTSSVAIDFSLNKYKIYDSDNGAYVETRFKISFANAANDEKFILVFKIFAGKEEDEKVVRLKLNTKDIGSNIYNKHYYVGTSVNEIISVADATATGKANANTGIGHIKTLKIGFAKNPSNEYKFYINGKSYTPSELGVTLKNKTTYYFTDVSLISLSTKQKVGTFATASFDNFKVNDSIKDDFDELTTNIWKALQIGSIEKAAL